MNKKYTFTMVVVKPTGKGGKPLNPKPIKPTKPIKPVQKSGGGMNDNKPKDPKPKVIPLLPEGVFYKGKAKDYPGIKELIKNKNKKSQGGEMLKGGQRKLDKNKDGKISGEDFKMMKAKIGKIATEEKYSTVEFGKTYHPITQSQMSNNIRKNFEGDKKFASSNELDDAHEKLKKNLSDKNVRPSEILKLDKEYEARKERAIKTVQKDLSSRPEMKELRKKTKGTVTDTGSTYSKGGEIKKGYKLAVASDRVKKKAMGGEMKQGAARQSGMGLQDENLQPGKSMDYYKDLI
jgi:uncharacterized protein YlbG (UPF0298 family)